MTKYRIGKNIFQHLHSGKRILKGDIGFCAMLGEFERISDKIGKLLWHKRLFFIKAYDNF